MDRLQDETVSELIDRARAGDREALSRLLSAYVGYLRQAAQHAEDQHRPQPLADGSDVVQDTLLEAFRDFGQFAGHNGAELKAWLRHVLLHNLLDEAKQRCAAKRSSQRQLYLEEIGWPNVPLEQLCTTEDSTPSAIVRQHETEAVLLRAIDRLPPDYRFVLSLRHFGGMSVPQISDLMGRSEAAVRSLWTRALQRLASALPKQP